jgi:hypothetical protein
MDQDYKCDERTIPPFTHQSDIGNTFIIRFLFQGDIAPLGGITGHQSWIASDEEALIKDEEEGIVVVVYTRGQQLPNYKVF